VEKSSDPDSPYIKAKKIVHGTNYGEGSKKIALLNDLDLKEVKELHTKWKDAIRATIFWQNLCAERAKREGLLTTPFGRKRWFYTSSYYTESLSFLPQSTAADVIFRAMIALMYERIGWPLEDVLRLADIAIPLPQPARLLLQVHDSLIFEYPPQIETELIRTVKTVMEQPWRQLGGFNIPIGIKVGNSWGECEEYAL
jgi:DNA polymerase I-like protein with 3'-5' exonuclease and polymerase domains